MKSQRAADSPCASLQSVDDFALTTTQWYKKFLRLIKTERNVISAITGPPVRSSVCAERMHGGHAQSCQWPSISVNLTDVVELRPSPGIVLTMTTSCHARIYIVTRQKKNCRNAHNSRVNLALPILINTSVLRLLIRIDILIISQQISVCEKKPMLRRDNINTLNGERLLTNCNLQIFYDNSPWFLTNRTISRMWSPIPFMCTNFERMLTSLTLSQPRATPGGWEYRRQRAGCHIHMQITIEW